MGAWINDGAIGITSTDLSNYVVINYINYGIIFLYIFMIWLLPLRKEVDLLHEEVKS